MARPLRIQASGLSYHVTARGSGRMDIYTDDRDRRTFLRLLSDVAESRGLSCHAYCLMSNHYHLVATTSAPNLSTAVKELNGPYAQWWNRRRGRVGHVFQGRFNAQIVQDDLYLLAVCRYVVLNPVRAGLVDAPEQWPWSSYRATAGITAPPPFLELATLWRHLGEASPGSGPRRYRELVSDATPGPSALPAEPVLGDAAFAERFRDWRQRAGPEVPRREREHRPALEELFAGAVTRAARNQQAAEAHRLGYRMAEIARFLDLNPGTVSRILEAAGRRAGARS